MALFFGIGAWISINGMWVELPLLVQTLPEAWNLPSYMSVIIQMANVGPIAYSLLHTLRPTVVKETNSIYVVMTIGTISSLLLVFLWTQTTVVDGVQHSTALFVLLFFISLVDCSSSVLFMPFMANFRQVYLTSYLIGEGLSGFLPSLFALAQGVGGNPQCNATDASQAPFYPPPRFSVSSFFLILFAMMVCSAAAFVVLNRSLVAKRERSHPLPVANSSAPIEPIKNSSQSSERSTTTSIDEDSSQLRELSDDQLSSRHSSEIWNSSISTSSMMGLLFMQCWICSLSNGALPSIQSYSCLPYGNTAYHLAVTLSSMANPLACIVAYYLPVNSVRIVQVMSGIGTLISGYIVALAAMSPAPPLLGYSSGETVMIFSWVLSVGVLTYAKVSIASILRRQEGKGNQNLFWFGVCTQIGSAVGSIVAFLLVNVFNLFTPYYPCA